MEQMRLLIDTELTQSEITWLASLGITTLQHITSMTWEEMVLLVGEIEAYRLLPIGLVVLAEGTEFKGMSREQLEEIIEEFAGHPVTPRGSLRRWAMIREHVVIPPLPSHIAA